MEAPVPSAQNALVDQCGHQGNPEAPAEMVVAEAPLADRLGTRALPQRAHRRRRGVLSESLEQPWGAGLGVLTPAVVAAALSAVPAGRAGLASAVNNTARQAGGAIGIAAFGALAGPPGKSGLITGFHAAALIAAGLFVASALATIRLMRSPRSA